MGLLCRFPLGPIMCEIIKASATKLQILFYSDVPDLKITHKNSETQITDLKLVIS